MGLDMYAYKAHQANAKAEWFNTATWDSELADFVNPNTTIEKPIEIAYWRKHPNLHGHMENLYAARGGIGDFNCNELELSLDDLLDLELTIKTRSLPPTQGFFFGNTADEHYYEDDLKFIILARQAIDEGYRVFYNSSW